MAFINRDDPDGTSVVAGSEDSKIRKFLSGGLMKILKRNRKSLLLVLVSVFVFAALPTVTSAQGRGRGQQKKHIKFVNGHDARDGKWDWRGPRGARVGQRIRNGQVFFPGRRVNRGNVILVPRNRSWRVDRNGDGIVDRNDYFLGRQQNRLQRLERRQTRRSVRRTYWNRRR